MKTEVFQFFDRKLPKIIDPIWTEHWSRPYEYGFILDRVQKFNPKTCHNTGCGYLPIHKSFYDQLKNYVEYIENSDIDERAPGVFPDYVKYDITQPNNKKFDLVLCISILEHLPSNIQIKALENLANQTNPGGKLILTCDYPDVRIGLLEDFFGTKCNAPPMDVLTGGSSVWPMRCFNDLAVVYLEVTI